MKSLSIGQHFHHYKYMGANFRHSRARNPEVNSLIWPKFELIREFMVVLATCKFDEDPIKTESTIDRTRPNMGFFGSQGQVTQLKSLIWPKFALIRAFMAVLVTCRFLPASLMNIRSKLNALSIRQGQIWAFSALKGNSDVNSLMWLEFELIRDFMAVWLPARLTKI